VGTDVKGTTTTTTTTPHTKHQNDEPPTLREVGRPREGRGGGQLAGGGRTDGAPCYRHLPLVRLVSLPLSLCDHLLFLTVFHNRKILFGSSFWLPSFCFGPTWKFFRLRSFIAFVLFLLIYFLFPHHRRDMILITTTTTTTTVVAWH